MMFSNIRKRTYLITWFLTITNYIILSSVTAHKYVRNAQAKNRIRNPSCLQIKAYTSDEFCYLNIWHNNGTRIYNSTGVDKYDYEDCYNHSKPCYSFEVGYYGDNEGGKCSFNVTLDGDMEKDNVEDTFFRLGECEKSDCGEQTELVWREFYGSDSFNYTHSAVGIEHGWTLNNHGDLEDGDPASICIDTSQCNVLQSTIQGSHANYYLLKGKNVYEKGELNDFETFGDCSNKLFLFINATYGGDGFNYTKNENGQEENNYLEAGNSTTILIDTNKCTTIIGNGNASYEIFHNDILEIGFDHSDYHVFGKCTCNHLPLSLISTRGDAIFQRLSSIWGMEVFIDVTSPQYMAACWLIKYDELNLNYYDTNIIQRYVMGLLFYATDGWNWNSYKGFLSTKHECDWKDETGTTTKGVMCNKDDMLKGIGLGK